MSTKMSTSPSPGNVGARRGRSSGTLPHIAASIGVDVERLGASFHDFLVDDHAADAVETRKLEHRLQQDRLHDGAQAARAGLAVDRLVGDGAQLLLVELR